MKETITAEQYRQLQHKGTAPVKQKKTEAEKQLEEAYFLLAASLISVSKVDAILRPLFSAKTLSISKACSDSANDVLFFLAIIVYVVIMW